MQIDDKRSEMPMVYFGVPQGSIMGPLISVLVYTVNAPLTATLVSGPLYIQNFFFNSPLNTSFSLKFPPRSLLHNDDLYGIYGLKAFT